MINESSSYTGRRAFLRTGMAGIGSWALSSLLAGETAATTLGTHFPPKAKRVIFLYMMGAPSQVDLFDHKPELLKNSGKPIPESLLKESMFAFITGRPDLLGSPYPFQKAGDSGIMISDLLPKIREIAGELTFIRTMHTDEVGHAAAELFLQSGFARVGRPSFGSWVSYGLGTMNKDLPAYVVLSASPTYNGSNTWTSGFLPAAHQGVRLRSGPEPLFYLSNPPGIT
ncbi:MAG: DUF1501 domain-containing protein, partial [Bryobacteraceae bacterium]|nr:DUF1501 domain-containing protein [Bryobacteraceae bacterium]